MGWTTRFHFRAMINATFSDFKLIRTRSVAQLVFELPIEQADAALVALGGVPQPAEERWVTINLARARQRTTKPSLLSDSEKARTRCVLLCKEHAFQAWIFVRALEENRQIGEATGREAECARLVRDMLGVASRAEIAHDDAARAKFRQLEVAYAQASGRVAEARG
ncbi:MAG: hypothetical protein ACRDGM_00130 [bacterium]